MLLLAFFAFSIPVLTSSESAWLGKNVSIRGVSNKEHAREMGNLMNAEQWSCGTAGIWEKIARGVMKKTCKDKMTLFNMCCSVHDDCYKLQKGKKNCDDVFCKCLDRAIRWKAASACFGAFPKTACRIVEWVGSSAYEDRSDEDVVKEYTPALNRTVQVYYRKLYKSCWDIRKTVSNCAYNHLVCHLKGLPLRYEQSYEHCLDGLIECLDDSSLALVDNYSECRTAVEAAIRAIRLDSKHSGFKALRAPRKPKKFYAVKPAPIYKQE